MLRRGASDPPAMFTALHYIAVILMTNIKHDYLVLFWNTPQRSSRRAHPPVPSRSVHSRTRTCGVSKKTRVTVRLQ